MFVHPRLKLQTCFPFSHLFIIVVITHGEAMRDHQIIHEEMIWGAKHGFRMRDQHSYSAGIGLIWLQIDKDKIS